MAAPGGAHYKQKSNIVIVYTGDGKGKTSAGIGLLCRALGSGSRVAFIQFIKSWRVSEDCFLEMILPRFTDKLLVYKGGKGFYHAGELSAKDVSENDHRAAAHKTYQIALDCVSSGAYEVVVCDEINNAVHDGLLTQHDLLRLIRTTHSTTSLCLTGRHFPAELRNHADIISDIKKVKHHFDEGFIAQKGVDF